MSEPSRTSAQKPAEGTTATEDEPSHNFVTCVYQLKLHEIYCQVTVTWAKTLINHSLYITVENAPQNKEQEDHYTCKIDLKTWQFWGKKGLKTFTVADKRFDVFWDLRAAKFSTRPEPDIGYYVALVSAGEMILLLGDQKDEALKRTKSMSCLEGTVLVHKKEIVYAKKCFCTKTTLGQNKEHSIMIEAVLSGSCDPEMWIFVDGTASIRLPNLHWRFRGNETIVVEGIPVQILWDVHGWLYNKSNLGVGIFVFRRGRGGVLSEGSFKETKELGNSVRDKEPAGVEFCHFVYACRT